MKEKEPEAAILISVVDNKVNIAYSKSLGEDMEDLLDILETAAIMVADAIDGKEAAIDNKLVH